MFDKAFAKGYIEGMAKKHKISIIARSVSSSGRAWRKSRSIKIPHPTNVDRFAVCLHEIYHIIGKKTTKSFINEYACDKYALDVLIELGMPTEGWIKRMKWHVLSRIAMAHNRRLDHATIPDEIRSFFPDIDLNDWKGMAVFVGHEYFKNPIPSNIILTPNMSKYEIATQLNRNGMTLDKSEIDDSTYGKWIVSHNGSITPFDSLAEIVRHYKLS